MRNYLLYCLFMILPLVVDGQNDYSSIFQWPEAYRPSECKFFVHNEIEIQAEPQVVWELLIRALDWPLWYPGADEVKINLPNDSILSESDTFYWKTMGLRFESTIRQYEPYRLLAWESKKKSIQGYHVWILLPTERGCKVITDEAQNGWLTFFEKIFQGNKLRKLHDVWLAQLESKSESTSNTR